MQFHQLETASVAIFLQETRLKGAETKGARLELIVRLGVLLRPELVQPPGSSKPEDVDAAAPEAELEVEGSCPFS